MQSLVSTPLRRFAPSLRDTAHRSLKKTMKLQIILLTLLSITSVHANEKNELEGLFQLTCFNGKIDSRSKCSTIIKLNRDISPDRLKGGLTCGYPDLTSEIKWEYHRKAEKKLHLRLERVFPLGSLTPLREMKDVTYEGERIVIFEDEHQVIVLEPITRKSEPVATGQRR